MQFIDLEGINFSDFVMSTSGTYHVLHVEISMVFTDDKLSQQIFVFQSMSTVISFLLQMHV